MHSLSLRLWVCIFMKLIMLLAFRFLWMLPFWLQFTPDL